MGVLSGWERSHSWAHVSGRAGGWASGMAAPADRQECPAPAGRLIEAGLRTWKPLSVSASIPHAAIASLRGRVGHRARPFRPRPQPSRHRDHDGHLPRSATSASEAPAPPCPPRPGVHTAQAPLDPRPSRGRSTSRQKPTPDTGVDIHGSGVAPWERSHVRCPCPRRHLSDRAPSARDDETPGPRPVGAAARSCSAARLFHSARRTRSHRRPARTPLSGGLPSGVPGTRRTGRSPPSPHTPVPARSPQEMTDALP